MARRSITARYDALAARGDELAGLERSVSPVHQAAVDVMTDLLRMGQDYSSSATPPHLKAMMRMLDKSRPMLLESLSNVPPAQVRVFIGELVDRLQVIVSTPLPEDTAHANSDAGAQVDDAGAGASGRDIAS